MTDERERARRELQAALAAHADDARRLWWERYLKGTAAFRGVPMGTIRAEVAALWRREVGAWAPAEAKALARELIAAHHSEDKLAGILLLAEHLRPHLSARDLPFLEEPFATGDIADWGVCDWFGVKVLAPLVARDGKPFARPLARWSERGPLWRRRVPAVAFAALAAKSEPFPGFDDLALAVAGALAHDDERFAQTGAGWLLRELSHREPERVRAAVVELEPLLSTEARRMALAKIEGRGRR